MANYINKSLQGHEGKALTLLPVDTLSFTVAEFGLNNVSGDPQFSWDGSGTAGVLQLGTTSGNTPTLMFGGTGGSQDGLWELFDDSGSLRLTNANLTAPSKDAFNFDTTSFVIGNATDETPTTIWGVTTLVADPANADVINLTGSLVISADLTVDGTTTTINTETLTVEDNVIELASNNIGDLLDIGWIGYRGSDSIGGGGVSNVAVFWDHTDNTFKMATTDDDASSPGLDITVEDYMPLRVGSIYASDVALTSRFVGNVDAELGLDVSGGQLAANAGGTFSGSTDWLFSGGDVHLNNGINLELGTSKDLTLVHTGAAGSITNTTGALTIENTATAAIAVVLGSTDVNTWFQIQDSNNSALFTTYGNGQVDIVTALNLPFKNVPTIAAAGNITYESGGKVIQYYDGSDWVTLAASTGTITLQAAYEAGNTVDLAQAEGDFAITLDDGPSAGAGIADFTVLGTGAENYLATDAVNSRVLIGDGANAITTIVGEHMLWGTDNTYDIGASGATRPRRVYVGTEVKVGDSVTIGTAAISASLGLTVSTGQLATDDMIFSASELSDDSFTIRGSTNNRDWFNLDMAFPAIVLGNTTDWVAATIYGQTRVGASATKVPVGNGEQAFNVYAELDVADLPAAAMGSQVTLDCLSGTTIESGTAIGSLANVTTGDSDIDAATYVGMAPGLVDNRSASIGSSAQTIGVFVGKPGPSFDDWDTGLLVNSGDLVMATAGGAVNLVPTGGSVTVSAGTFHVTTDGDEAEEILLGTTAAKTSSTINIVNRAGTSDDSIVINSIAGGVTIQAGGTDLDLESATNINLRATGGSGAINIGDNDTADTINIGTNGARPINIGSTTAGDTTALNLGSEGDLTLSTAAGADINLTPGAGNNVDVTVGLNLPGTGGTETEGNIRYNAGLVQYFTTEWVDLAAATGSVSLQGAYETGNTIALAQSEGDFAVTLDDGPSAGAGIADFTVSGTGAENYLATDAVNQRILLGDSTIDAYMNGSDLLWTADGGGNIGNPGPASNRPDHIYAATDVVIGDTITITGSALTSSAALGLTSGGSASDHITINPGSGEVRVESALRLAEQSGDPTNVADNGFIFTKAGLDSIGDTDVELFYEDDQGNVVQLTQEGFINTSSVGMPHTTGASYDNLEDSSNNFFSAGRTTGGAITDAGGGTYDVALGTGYVRISNSPLHIAQLVSCDWVADTGIAIADTEIKNVGIEYNAGSPQVVVHDYPYAWNNHSEFPLGTVIREGATLHIQNDPMFVADGLSHTQYRFWQTEPNDRDDRTGGLIIGETGDRNMTVSAGALWDRLNRFAISAIDTNPSIGADTFDRYWVSGGGPNFTLQAAQTQWDNTQYNKSDNTLATMTAAYYAVQWFWLELDGDLVSMYGTDEYATLAEAENEDVPGIIPDRLSIHGTLIGRIIFQKDAGTADEIQSVYTTVFSASAAADHGNLAGLADDDHTQYSLVNGSRAYTGGVEINSLEGLTTNQEVINLGTDGSAAVGVPEFTTAERNALTPDKGWTIFNETTGALEIYNGASWESAAASLQEAYEAGPTITLSDSIGDLEFIIDETGTVQDFIVRGEGASIGASNEYLRTDGTNKKLILGEASVSATLVETQVKGGLSVTDELDGDGDAALSLTADVGRNLAIDEWHYGTLSSITSSGLVGDGGPGDEGALAAALGGLFAGHSSDGEGSVITGVASTFTGLNGGSAAAMGALIQNTASENDYTAHIVLGGGSQGNANQQSIAAFHTLQLQTFEGPVLLAPASGNIYSVDSNFLFSTDNNNDIGQEEDNRPANVYVGTQVQVAGNSIGSDGVSLTATALTAGDDLTISSGSSQDIDITSDANLNLTAGASSEIWNVVQDSQGAAWKIIEGSTTILWVNTGTDDIRGVYPLTLEYAVQSGESILKGTGTSVADADGASAVNGTLISGGLSGSESLYGVIGSVSGDLGDSANATLSAFVASTAGKQGGDANLMGLNIGSGFDHDIIFSDSTAQVSATGQLDIAVQNDFNMTLANSTPNPYTLTIAAIHSGAGSGDTNLDIQAETKIDLTCIDGDITFSPGSGSLGAGAGVVDVNTALNLPFGQANERRGNFAYNDGDDTLQYYDGANWISVAAGSGPGALDLQDAYDNGPTIVMDGGTGSLAISVDEVAAEANFTLTGITSGENYFSTDGATASVVLGDANIVVGIKDTLVGWATDGGGDIGQAADNRPDNIYAKTLVKAGDGITVNGSTHAITSSTTLDIDATGALSIDSSGGSINIGTDVVAQNINIGTGVVTRDLTIGNVDPNSTLALRMGNNEASAFILTDGNNWMQFNTATPAMTFGNGSDNPATSFLASTFGVTATSTVDIDGAGEVTVSTTSNNENIVLSPHGTGRVKILDDIRLTFGTNDEATIKYDEAGNDRLTIGGADVEILGDLVFGAPQASKSIGSQADDATDGFRPLRVFVNTEVEVGTDLSLLSGEVTTMTGALTLSTGNGGNGDIILAPFGTGEVEVQGSRLKFDGTSYLNLPTATGSAITGDIRYNAGEVEHWSGGVWVPLANSTGSVSLQDAYDAGQTIALDGADGDMVITLDEASIGGDPLADFVLTGSTGDYLKTNVSDGPFLMLGSSNIPVVMEDTILAWADDGVGDIGASDGNRPGNVFVESSVTIEDLVSGDSEKVVLTEQSLAFTANSALAKTFTISGANSGASVCNFAMTTDGKIELTATTLLNITAGASSLWTFNTNDDDALTLTDGVDLFLTLNTTTDAKQVEFDTFVRTPRGADVNDNTGPSGGGVVMTDGDSGALGVGYITYALYAGGETKAIRADAGAPHSIGAPDQANVFGVVVAKSGQECQINTIHGMPVPVYFAGAPSTDKNGQIVYLSTEPGEATLTPPSASETDVWQLGILVGADGASTTPNVIWMPQFRYSNA